MRAVVFAFCALSAWSLSVQAAPGSPGNRLTHLDDPSPFTVDANSPRITTPMWLGEEGVEAAVILSIDDMREESVTRYRDFIAPILAKLKEIEGYSPLNIFTNEVLPDNPQLQKWIDDGVRCDVHTRTHPCPLLRNKDAAASEVFDCLENLNRIPNHQSVAFRMPCTDSINSASPLFFNDILPQRTAGGGFLEVDTSISVFPSAEYKKYAPFTNYGATISGHPYPYVVGGLVWEFPIVVPTDWQAQHLRGVNHEETVAEMKQAVDIVVAQQGLYSWCFHPHGWLRSEQIVDIVSTAHQKYGSKVRFLNIQEALDKITRNMLGGVPLRAPDGQDNGVRILDLDADGFMDVVIGNDERRQTRRWNPDTDRWDSSAFPFQLVTRVDDVVRETGVRFGVLQSSKHASAIFVNGANSMVAHFDGSGWRVDGLKIPDFAGNDVRAASKGRDLGVRIRDVDGDGFSDLLVSNPQQNALLRWNENRFSLVDGALPALGSIVDAHGHDGGVRFWDLDGDGNDDVVLSNDEQYYVYLYDEAEQGWTDRVLHGAAGAPGALPKFVSEGENRGAWIQDGKIYVANEITARNADLVETRDVEFLLEHRALPSPLPEAALETLHVPAGFAVELVAAEPLVADPISIEFGADGRVWVTEMGSYPLGVGPDADGRVRVLRDTDSDGELDRSTVFVAGLSFPAGALPYRSGVLVTCAPDILYFEDTGGDDVADSRRVVFTGFGAGNQQHRVNGLHYGIDNWIYGANGDSGGSIRAPESDASVGIGGRDFRISLDLKTFEATSGTTQYGLAMDDFGSRFGASNARHIMHSIAPQRYLNRNPHYAPPHPVRDIAEHGAMARIHQISKQTISLNSIHVPGHFSAAAGISVYRDEIFPEEYRGSTFVGDAVGNVVHRDVLVEDGATYKARRSPKERELEFLASTDPWFRPVYTTTGPDGALYVVDMHRYTIEHPQYIGAELQQILDFGAGRDRGRIYRVVWNGDDAPEQAARRRETRIQAGRVVKLSDTELAARLDHTGGWWRDTAQRLLLERNAYRAKETIAPLTRNERPSTRAHALWTLAGLGSLTEVQIHRALADPNHRVREHAVRLFEEFARAPVRNLDVIAPLVSDPSFRVRLQLAFTLGNIDSPEASRLLARVFSQDSGDPWMQAALLSARGEHSGRLLALLFGTADKPVNATVLQTLIRTVVRRGQVDELKRIVASLPKEGELPDWCLTLAASLGSRVAEILSEDDSALERIVAKARRVTAAPEESADRRIEAVRALANGSPQDVGSLASLLSARESHRLQVAVVQQLALQASRGENDKAWWTLIGAWQKAGPSLRSEVAEALLSTVEGSLTFLAAVEDKVIAARELGASVRRRLISHDSERVKDRATALLPAPVVSTATKQTIEHYVSAARQGDGSPERGREVFEEHCSTCHRHDGVGHQVGPSLADASDKDNATLIGSILDPSGVVSPQFTSFVVTTQDGRVATGLIASESDTAVTLRRAGGVEETLLRADIVDITSSNVSLMPADLQRVIDPQRMRDLLSFLRQHIADLNNIDDGSAAVAREAVLASGHNGLARILSCAETHDQDSWTGRRPMYLARQLTGDHEIVWETEPVPKLPPGESVELRFPIAIGYVSQPQGHFELRLDDQLLLLFDVSLESTTWKGEDERVQLHYSVRARNGEDSTGLMTLVLPAALTTAGKPVQLSIRGSKTNSRRWVGLMPLRGETP